MRWFRFVKGPGSGVCGGSDLLGVLVVGCAVV